ncbi:MAG TPA: WHG domain-containing protein [Nocardioidaceae bacterium]|nr:WHG domain-containing protein [Nocardioidaceae bacterium]
MPRAGLSPDVVVAEAVRLVDQVGPQRLTLAALAQRFGVALPSLYKHVGGLEDLHGRLAVVAAGEVARTLRRAATGRSGADALSEVAAAYRRYAVEHPGCYGYLLRPRPDDPAHAQASGEILEVLFGVLAGYGITRDADAVDATRLLRSSLHGWVVLETAGGFAMAHPTDRSFVQLVASLDRALASWPQ